MIFFLFIFLPIGLILGKKFWRFFFHLAVFKLLFQYQLNVPSRETTKTSLQLAYILNLFCVFALL